MDDLGADEAARQVGVNDAGGLLRHSTVRDGPGAHIFFASVEERAQAKKLIGGPDEAVEARFL